MEVADAVILVTGSSHGIGAACAAALHARGARVLLHGRHPDRLSRASADLGVKTLRADLAEEGAAERLAASALDVHGRLDAVVHCAGVGWYGSTAEMTGAAIDDLIDVNLRAPMRLTSAVLPEMVRRGSGHLAFIASIAGLTGVACEAVYAGSKAGLITYADSLRLELRGTGVGISVISPAAVRTEFFEHRGAPYGRRIPRLIDPNRIAQAVVRAVADEVPHQVVPRWLAAAPATKALMPPLYRALARRFG